MHWRCRGMGRGPTETQRQETNEAMKSQDKKLVDKKHIPMAQPSLFCALLWFPWEESEWWKNYKMHLFWTLKCIKTVYFCLQNWVVVSESLFDLKGSTYVLTWNHIFSPLHVFVFVCEASAGPCCVCTELLIDSIPSTWPNAACVWFLCVCAFGILLSVDRVPGCPRWL